MKNLRELADMLVCLADKIENLEGVQDYQHFSVLQDDLNTLQVEMPKAEAVLAARVSWFKHGLASFERDFVQPVIDQVDGWAEWNQNYCGSVNSPPRLIMNWETLRHFLTRGYLGAAFLEICPQVEEMLDHIVDASEGSELQEFWKGRRDSLHREILAGWK